MKSPDKLQRAFFDLDQSSLRADAKAALDADAKLLAEHSGARIEIQGHCDERGSTEYNLALGQRRANAARAYLTKAGVAANRIKTVSYGEERPLSQGGDEYAWGQNRRVEVVIISGGDDMIQGSTN